MRDHFSYLYEEPETAFMTKAACRGAEEVYGVSAATPPAELVKQASVKLTPFTKVASRIDRDMGILKEAGPSGLNGGMMMRADAYLDVLASGVDMTAEQFGEVFDKVAAEAIQTDLNAAYSQICEDVEEGLHRHVALGLMKVGKELTELALLEKEAVVGRFLGKLLTRGKRGKVVAEAAGLAGGVGAQAAAAGRAVGSQVARPFKAVSRGVKGEVDSFRAARRQKIMNAPAKIRADLAAARKAVPTNRFQAARNEAKIKSHEKSLGKAEARADKKVDSGWDVPGVNTPMNPKAPKTQTAGAPANTTAPKGPEAQTATAAGQAKTIKAEGERGRASDDAAAAAGGGRPKLTVHEGGKGKGTGTDGPEPQPAAKPDTAKTEGKPAGDATPDAPKTPVKIGDAFNKVTTNGWKSLSQEEKGALIRAGIYTAAGVRLVTGKGAVTGGEGLI